MRFLVPSFYSHAADDHSLTRLGVVAGREGGQFAEGAACGLVLAVLALLAISGGAASGDRRAGRLGVFLAVGVDRRRLSVLFVVFHYCVYEVHFELALTLLHLIDLLLWGIQLHIIQVAFVEDF